MKGHLIIGKNNAFYNINNNLIKVNINGNNNKVINPYKITDLYIHGNNNILEIIGNGNINHIKFFGNNNKIYIKNYFQPQYTDLGIGNLILKCQLPFFPSNRIIFQPWLSIRNQNLMNHLNVGSTNIDERVNDFLHKLKEDFFSEIPSSLRCSSNECFLCKRPFIEKEIIKIFSCNKHIFHKECLKDWLKTNINSPKCPKCDQLSLNLQANPFIPLLPHIPMNEISSPRFPIIQNPLNEENHNDEPEPESLNDLYEEDDEEEDAILDEFFLNRGRGVNNNILDNMVISKIKNIDKLDNDKKKCTICLENFVNGDDSIALPCIHIFHAICIKTWLKNQNTCPICKYKVNDDVFDDDEIYD